MKKQDSPKRRKKRTVNGTRRRIVGTKFTKKLWVFFGKGIRCDIHVYDR